MTARRRPAARLLATLAATGLAVAGCRAVPIAPSEGASPPAGTASSVIKAPVLARIPLTGAQQVAVAGGAIWVIEDIDEIGRLTRIDPATNGVTRLSPAMDDGLDVGDDSLWASSATIVNGQYVSETLVRVDTATGALTPAKLPALPEGMGEDIAIGLGSVWMSVFDNTKRVPATPRPSLLWRVDPASGEIVWSQSLDMGSFLQVACGDVWGRNGGDGIYGTLQRLDPVTGAVANFQYSGLIYERVDGCWRQVSNGFERIAPGQPTTYPNHWRGNLVFDGHDFWDWRYACLERLDPVTGTSAIPCWLVDPVDLKKEPDGQFMSWVVAAGGSLWLVNRYEAVRFDIPAG